MESLYLGSVSLFYAKDRYGNPRLIDEIDDGNRDEEYTCFVCGAQIKPRAIESDKMSKHFYHVAGSECSAESVMHYWYKEMYLKDGDKFKLLVDGQYIDYECKELIVEKTYKTLAGNYRPDATVITTSGEEIFVEYNYKNKKKKSEYVDRWTELNKTVVELNISKLDDWKEKIFNPVFYNGESLIEDDLEMCHSMIKKCLTPEELNNRQRVKYLNWLLRDFRRYMMKEISIQELAVVIDNLNNVDKQCMVNMIKGLRCQNILNEYTEYKFEIAKEILKEELYNNNMHKYEVYEWMLELCYTRKFGSMGMKFNNTIRLKKRLRFLYDLKCDNFDYNIFCLDFKDIKNQILECVKEEIRYAKRNHLNYMIKTNEDFALDYISKGIGVIRDFLSIKYDIDKMYVYYNNMAILITKYTNEKYLDYNKMSIEDILCIVVEDINKCNDKLNIYKAFKIIEKSCNQDGDIRQSINWISEGVYRLSLNRKYYNGRNTVKIIDVIININDMEIELNKYGYKSLLKITSFIQMNEILKYIIDMAVELYI